MARLKGVKKVRSKSFFMAMIIFIQKKIIII